MSDKELYIIRHGETDFNLQGIVQGRGVDPSLNETGRIQADKFHDYYCNESFDAVFTSTLRRTHESVKEFVEKGIPWKQFAALDEISWGIFEGKSASHEFKEAYKNLVNSWRRGFFYSKAVEGESPLEVQQRLQHFIDDLSLLPEKKILICMHGRALRIFLPTLLKEPLSRMDDYPHHNLTLYKVILQDGFFVIDQFNNRDHLHERKN